MKSDVNHFEGKTMSHKAPRPITRREALCRMGSGFGMMAFAGLVGESLARAQSGSSAGSPRWPKGGIHHAARAKHVIFLFMGESFDPNPEPQKETGKPAAGGPITAGGEGGPFAAPEFPFKKMGGGG